MRPARDLRAPRPSPSRPCQLRPRGEAAAQRGHRELARRAGARDRRGARVRGGISRFKSRSGRAGAKCGGEVKVPGEAGSGRAEPQRRSRWPGRPGSRVPGERARGGLDPGLGPARAARSGGRGPGTSPSLGLGRGRAGGEVTPRANPRRWQRKCASSRLGLADGQISVYGLVSRLKINFLNFYTTFWQSKASLRQANVPIKDTRLQRRVFVFAFFVDSFGSRARLSLPLAS